MRARLEEHGPEVSFVIADVEPALTDAVQALAFRPDGGGTFRQTYPAGYPAMDRIFANFERCIEPLVLQKARLLSVPWERALRTFCETVAGHDLDWWLTGSAALAVRGIAVAPRDLDLNVGRESAAEVERLMLDHLIEPPRPGFISDTFTRSFPDACVEWCAGIDERADAHMIGDVGLTAQGRLETVEWQGFSIRVPPLDLQLVVNDARGLTDRVALIQRALTGTTS